MSGEDVEHGKPAPEIYLTVAERLGVHPSQCAVIEDSLNGVKAAKSAGMFRIAVPDPCWSNKKDFSIADLVMDRLDQVDIKTIDCALHGKMNA